MIRRDFLLTAAIPFFPWFGDSTATKGSSGKGTGKSKKGFGFDTNPGNEIYELPPPVYPNKNPQED